MEGSGAEWILGRIHLALKSTDVRFVNLVLTESQGTSATVRAQISQAVEGLILHAEKLADFQLAADARAEASAAAVAGAAAGAAQGQRHGEQQRRHGGGGGGGGNFNINQSIQQLQELSDRLHFSTAPPPVTPWQQQHAHQQHQHQHQHQHQRRQPPRQHQPWIPAGPGTSQQPQPQPQQERLAQSFSAAAAVTAAFAAAEAAAEAAAGESRHSREASDASDGSETGDATAALAAEPVPGSTQHRLAAVHAAAPSMTVPAAVQHGYGSPPALRERKMARLLERRHERESRQKHLVEKAIERQATAQAQRGVVGVRPLLAAAEAGQQGQQGQQGQ